MILHNAHSVQEYLIYTTTVWNKFQISCGRSSCTPTPFPISNKSYLLPQSKNETITSIIIIPNKNFWLCAIRNELGRWAQGNDHGFHFTDTTYFIFISEVPNDRSDTYEPFVRNYKPLKSEPHFLYCVAGGYKLDYPDDPGSPSAPLVDTKLLLNSTITD